MLPSLRGARQREAMAADEAISCKGKGDSSITVHHRNAEKQMEAVFDE